MKFLCHILLLIAFGTVGSPLSIGQTSNSAIRLPVILEADQRTELLARVEGYVAKVHVDIGDRVTEGQLLISLDAPELEADLRRQQQMLLQANAELAVAQGNVTVAQARLRQAESSRLEQEAMRKLRITERDRYAKLVENGAVQREKLDEAEYGVMAVRAAVAQIEADVEAARADIAAAKNQVASAAAGIEVAKAELAAAAAQDKLRMIVAPFDGLISRRDVDEGQLVSAGTAMGSALLVIEHVEVLRGIVSLPANQTARVQFGDWVTLTDFDQDSPIVAPGGGDLVISRLSQSLDTQTRTMRVEIDIENRFDSESNRYPLLSGQYGSAVIKPKRP